MATLISPEHELVATGDAMLTSRAIVLCGCLTLGACSQSTDRGGSLATGGSTPTPGGTGAGGAAGSMNGSGGLNLMPQGGTGGDEPERGLPSCVACRWPSCPDGKKTTVSGTVRT